MDYSQSGFPAIAVAADIGVIAVKVGGWGDVDWGTGWPIAARVTTFCMDIGAKRPAAEGAEVGSVVGDAKPLLEFFNALDNFSNIIV